MEQLIKHFQTIVHEIKLYIFTEINSKKSLDVMKKDLTNVDKK